jgi:hypothetical protein
MIKRDAYRRATPLTGPTDPDTLDLFRGPRGQWETCPRCGAPVCPPDKHPDYDRWVEVWGKMHADDENREWLRRQRVPCHCREPS